MQFPPRSAGADAGCISHAIKLQPCQQSLCSDFSLPIEVFSIRGGRENRATAAKNNRHGLIKWLCLAKSILIWRNASISGVRENASDILMSLLF